MNYIKGFRYELYCLARTIKSTHCCIWLCCDEATSDLWAASRTDAAGGTYPPDVLLGLRRRFEPPNERNRWDRPLFTARTSANTSSTGAPSAEWVAKASTETLPGALDALQLEGAAGSFSASSVSVSAAAAAAPEGSTDDRFDDAVVSSSFRRKGKVSAGASVASTFRRAAVTAKAAAPEALVFHRLDAFVASPCSTESANASRREGSDGSLALPAAAIATTSAAELRTQLFASIYSGLCGPVAALPNSSTVKIQRGNADILYELDHVSQLITHAIAAHQSGSDMQAGTPLLLPAYGRSLELHRTVSLPELQRHRTQFVRLNSKHPPADGTQAGAMFVDFLAVQL